MSKLDVLIIAAALVIAFIIALAFSTGEAGYWVLLTRLGNEEIYLVLGVLVYYFAGDFTTSVSVLTSVLVSGSLNVFLKYMFNTPRPLNPLVEATGPGFPSGHAQVSSSFWLAISMGAKRSSLTLLSLVVITGVSLSRIYLRAHYPIDVIGGLLFGVTSAILSYYSTKGFATGRKQYLVALLASAILIGAYNLLVLNIEHEAVTALLGLTSSLLLSLIAFNKYLDSLKFISVRSRVACFIVSSFSLIALHYSTEFINPFSRAVLFFLMGLVVFVGLPFYASRYRICKCS
ncbi:MAG: phosphatase PAP2 family protein [Desulfurococcaceae archaeon]